jgi:antitoxin (DNA-binding transcriptional repressor) of toxin-antitoxin stability system
MSSELISGTHAVSIHRDALDDVMDGVTVHLTLLGRPVAALVPLDLAPADEHVQGLGEESPEEAERLDALLASYEPAMTPEALALVLGAPDGSDGLE